MPFDGNTFLPARDFEADQTNSVTFSAARFMEVIDDIAAGLTTLKQGGATDEELTSAIESAVNNLLGGVSSSFDTLKEAADAIGAIQTTIAALQATDSTIQADLVAGLAARLTQTASDARYVRTVNSVAPDGSGNVLATTANLTVDGTDYAGIGLLYGGTTFVYSHDGTISGVRIAASETSAQLHYDNILLGLVTSSTVTISNASPSVVTWAGHGLVAGTAIAFSTTGSLPSGVSAATNYYVIATGLTTDTFRYSATPGGTAINTVSSGSGVHTCKALKQTPGATWKVPDFNAKNGGNDHALMNVGVSEASGTYPNTFIFEGGYAGPSTEAGIGFLILTPNSAGTQVPRLHITSKQDNTAIGFGVFGASSEVQGTFFQLHTSNAATASHIHFTTATTGSNGTDGASVGLWTADELRVWHYENQPILFGSNNAEQARLTTTGLGVGVTATSKLHARSSGTGGLTAFKIDYANTSSGETHVSQFMTQDSGGTIRTLFYAAGALNAGVNDQGLFAVFNEAGSMRMFEVDSLAANSAARFRLYDRSNVATINLHGGGSSTFAGGALLNTHATAGLGYGTGAGGTVTQATSKSTGVTLDKSCGTITMNNAALAAATSVSFTLTCAAIAATDLVIVNIKSGATANSYQVTVSAVAAGSCSIHVRNISGGSLSEAVVLSYAVIKAVAA